MAHNHEGQPHVTKTFGRKIFMPVPVLWAFRMGAKRGDMDSDRRLHYLDVMERWIGRWANREGVAWGGFHVAATESDDALVVGFLAIKGVPDDWLCLAGMIPSLYKEDHDHSETIVPIAMVDLFPDMKLPQVKPDEPKVKPN